MRGLLWLIPLLPLVGFVLLTLLRLPRAAVALIGVGSIGLSALLSTGIAIEFLRAPPSDFVFTQTLWTWMAIGNFTPTIGLYLDPLALLMMLVITGVGFLIHLYSAGFMLDDAGYARFFSYMNLFVAAMLALVLADNLLFLYLGWEGVGLCSYLLIGFWYADPANGLAARKAFVVTRVGDTAMAIGLFVLFWSLDTLDIQTLVARAQEQWAVGAGIAVAVTLLLLGGALGKSAQLPLQTWLPDAMAGPTPVSALIHAATMVTAGVYLIARLHGLYVLAPAVQLTVAVIGALTLLIAAFAALAQHDIKRVLAYSTVSQIGYMFLALGVGAWSAAMFHFMTHAFFKALLFLAAGAVIYALHHEHDIFKMGGLRTRLPVAFWTFLIGAASLASLPLVTAGFYSKDLILWQVWASEQGGAWLWAAAWVGAFLTALYTFRLLFIAFFGEAKTEVEKRPRLAMQLPLVVLAVLAVIGGFVELPPTLGNLRLVSDFLAPSLPAGPAGHASLATEVFFQLLAAGAALAGVAVAYVLFLRRPGRVHRLLLHPRAQHAKRFLFSGWGFDWVYDRLIVRPFLWLADKLRHDVIDTASRGAAFLMVFAHYALSRSQTGKVRWYAAGLAAGAVAAIALVLLP